MKEEIESKVNIRPVGNAYLIEVSDQFVENKLAVTKEELEAIIVLGQAILK